ncbi:hypothetical protein DRH14_01905 [Candidatus Shapirobacteria bacterium]|nr:MAG: hypothetical protein DRH14_01905 [Candidatus Shapirobacteria bacterium]
MRFTSILLFLLIVFFLILKYPQLSSPTSPSYFDSSNPIKQICFNSFCLSNKDNQWFIDDDHIPVDAEKIDHFLKQIQQVKLDNLISSNPQKQKQYFSTSSNFIKIGDKQLQIGNLSSDYVSTFVKQKDEDKIFKIPFVWNFESFQTNDYWQLSFITNLPIYQIKEIITKREDKQQKIQPKDGQWLDQSFVDTLSHLKVVKYIGNQTPSSVSSSFEITVDKDQKYLVEIGVKQKKGQDKLFWATSNHSFYYQISSTDFKRLTSVFN